MDIKSVTSLQNAVAAIYEVVSGGEYEGRRIQQGVLCYAVVTGLEDEIVPMVFDCSYGFR